MKNSKTQPMKNSLYLIAILAVSLTASCGQAPKKKKENTETTKMVITKKSLEISINAKSGSDTSGMV